MTFSTIPANPVSSFNRPANTTAYAANSLIATSTTAGSVSVPSFNLSSTGDACAISRIRLWTNATSGWGGAYLQVNLWSAPPTYTNGDGGAYAVATGSANYIGSFTATLTQYGDGAVGIAAPSVGSLIFDAPSSGSAIYWDVEYTGSASLTPISGQTFTLTVELID